MKWNEVKPFFLKGGKISREPWGNVHIKLVDDYIFQISNDSTIKLKNDDLFYFAAQAILGEDDWFVIEDEKES